MPCASERAGAPSRLFLAARAGDLAAARALMAGGADGNAPDKWHRTPLYVAAREGHAAVVAELLACGVTVVPGAHADPDTQRKVPLTPGERKALEDRVGAIASIVQVLGGPEASNLHMQLVAVATTTTIPDSRTEDDFLFDTPLKAACRRGHVETVRLLVAAGADIEHVTWGRFGRRVTPDPARERGDRRPPTGPASRAR